MAHFAKLDENNIVQMVIVVHNDAIHNLPFPESEFIGIEFCRSLFGADTQWVQTSYNSSFRYNYAGIGDSFDQAVEPHGAFIGIRPFESWTLNSSYKWEAPVPCPSDGKPYYWDEASQSWSTYEEQN